MSMLDIKEKHSFPALEVINVWAEIAKLKSNTRKPKWRIIQAKSYLVQWAENVNHWVWEQSVWRTGRKLQNNRHKN